MRMLEPLLACVIGYAILMFYSHSPTTFPGSADIVTPPPPHAHDHNALLMCTGLGACPGGY